MLQNFNVQIFNLPVDPEIIRNVLALPKIKNTKNSNIGGWQIHLIPTNSEPWIADLMVALLSVMGINNKYRIDRLWVNINLKSDYNRWHKHQPGGMVGVYYIQVPNAEGKIMFRNETGIGEFVPSTGNILMFPGDLEHSVAPSESNIERISLAFNLKRR